MKMKKHFSFILLSAVMVMAIVSFIPWKKEENKVMAEEQARALPAIDMDRDVSFETATFSLG